MPAYLIDVNLPYRFSVWSGEEFIHQYDLGDTWTDEEIWNYAQKNNLTIVTKDADFSNKMITSNPPPKVVHLKIGNMKMNDFHTFISKVWEDIVEMNKHHKLINVFEDRIEGIGNQ